MSRVILKRGKREWDIVRVRPGQGISEHTSPFDALVQGLEGDAEVTVASKPIVVKPGQ